MLTGLCFFYIWDKSHSTTGNRKMLKTVKNSTANKTAGLAVTYRAGNGEKFGTCPADCKLNDSGRGCGAGQIDFEYLDAVLDAKPRRGESFTYSHFHPLYWAQKLAPNKTTINYSADTLAEAVAICANKIAPVVIVVKKSFWKNGKFAVITRDDIPAPVRVIRCPAEYLNSVGCVNCGGKDGPYALDWPVILSLDLLATASKRKKLKTVSAAGVMRRAAMLPCIGPPRLAKNKNNRTATSCGLLSKHYRHGQLSGITSRAI